MPPANAKPTAMARAGSLRRHPRRRQNTGDRLEITGMKSRHDTLNQVATKPLTCLAAALLELPLNLAAGGRRRPLIKTGQNVQNERHN